MTNECACNMYSNNKNNPMMGTMDCQGGGTPQDVFVQTESQIQGTRGSGDQIGRKKTLQTGFPWRSNTRPVLAPESVSQPSTTPYCIYLLYVSSSRLPTSLGPPRGLTTCSEKLIFPPRRTDRGDGRHGIEEMRRGRAGGRPCGRQASRPSRQTFGRKSHKRGKCEERTKLWDPAPPPN